MKNKIILLGVTGSISCYKVCDIITRLRRKRYEIICIMTKEARKFITPLTLESLSGNKTYIDMFELPEKRDLLHISLAQKADVILICPATANIIAKLASGICDDLLTCTVLSSKSTVLIAPAMNENMYKHPVTRNNISRLKKFGYKIIPPVRGRLACGHEGLGHLADVEVIISHMEKLLKK